jgi:aryl-alcohol dehydrogenase-like predicted oxidoreductase
MTTNGYKSLRELSDRKLVAIDALLTGATHSEAADQAGVHRVTVSKWVSGHPAFQAELSRRRQERNEQRAARLRELDEAALDAVAHQLDTSDSEFALKWLKLRGINSSIHPAPGPTDAEEIIERRYRARLESARNDPMLERVLNDLSGVDPDRVRQEVEAELAQTYDGAE